MNNLPNEIVDHIIYFTSNNIFDLCLINKYVNQNSKKIRIITIDNQYPLLRDQHLTELTNLTVLNLSCNNYITDDGIYKLINLTDLNLANNFRITDDGISGLTNLKHLNLYDNY